MEARWQLTSTEKRVVSSVAEMSQLLEGRPELVCGVRLNNQPPFPEAMLPTALSSPALSLGMNGADVPMHMYGSFPEGTQHR